MAAPPDPMAFGLVEERSREPMVLMWPMEALMYKDKTG